MIEGIQIPVLSLEYEYQAYLKLGRIEKAERLKKWLQGGLDSSERNHGRCDAQPTTV
jgi:hypothetical protein